MNTILQRVEGRLGLSLVIVCSDVLTTLLKVLTSSVYRHTREEKHMSANLTSTGSSSTEYTERLTFLISGQSNV